MTWRSYLLSASFLVVFVWGGFGSMRAANAFLGDGGGGGGHCCSDGALHFNASPSDIQSPLGHLMEGEINWADVPVGYAEKYPERFDADGNFIADPALLLLKEAFPEDYVQQHPERFDDKGVYQPPARSWFDWFALPTACCTNSQAATSGALWGVSSFVLLVVLVGGLAIVRRRRQYALP